jgi:hypothetical protein
MTGQVIGKDFGAEWNEKNQDSFGRHENRNRKNPGGFQGSSYTVHNCGSQKIKRAGGFWYLTYHSSQRAFHF